MDRVIKSKIPSGNYQIWSRFAHLSNRQCTCTKKCPPNAMGHLIDSSDLQSQLLFVANLKYNFIAAHIALKNRE